MRITFIRHGQSEANVAEVWQGRGNSPLSPEGRDQAKKAAARLAGRRFDLVVSSPLDRARDTVAALGVSVETDRRWTEMDLGGWEGKTSDEVKRLHPDLLQAIRRGEAVAFGETGETLKEFEGRVLDAFWSLIERVGDGSALVATHGGVIDAIVGHHLGRVERRRTFPIVTNTSLTTVEGVDGGTRLSLFNDATHLGLDVGFVGRMRRERTPVVGFVRHGVTEANKQMRIQGRQCWGLDEEGRTQARQFASWYGPVEHVFSSPLLRASETAALLGEVVEEEPALQEMAFGDWEGRDYRDLMSNGDGLARRIWTDGEDLPRGGSGESFAMVRDRMRSFLDALEIDAERRTLVVSHGAAIKSLVASIHERGFDIHPSLATSVNTGVSHIALTEEGPVLADYSLAPHLDEL